VGLKCWARKVACGASGMAVEREKKMMIGKHCGLLFDTHQAPRLRVPQGVVQCVA